MIADMDRSFVMLLYLHTCMEDIEALEIEPNCSEIDLKSVKNIFVLIDIVKFTTK